VKILDLFCGAGGASFGYHQALPDAEIVGIDIDKQPRYPFTFIQTDATRKIEDVRFLRSFDLIHASTPCQRYSDLAHRNGNGDEWPNYISPVRWHLQRSRVPYVIENVEGAPLNEPLLLCGTMFPQLRVIRHRLFEASFAIEPIPHPSHPLVFTHDKRKDHHGRLDQDTAYVQVTGGGNATIANKLEAMGIDWMINEEVNEAIPPAYTEYIGKEWSNPRSPLWRWESFLNGDNDEAQV
jgi:DNA (cytosine-5)-methyltransferase 1